MQRGLADRAIRASIFFPVVERMVERSKQAADWAAFLGEGRQHYSYFLGVAHDDPLYLTIFELESPGDLAERRHSFDEWESRARFLATQMSNADPEWFQAWQAGRLP